LSLELVELNCLLNLPHWHHFPMLTFTYTDILTFVPVRYNVNCRPEDLFVLNNSFKSEQISSKVLATVALHSVLAHLPQQGKEPRPTEAQIKDFVTKDLGQLAMRQQRWTGQFSFW